MKVQLLNQQRARLSRGEENESTEGGRRVTMTGGRHIDPVRRQERCGNSGHMFKNPYTGEAES